MESLASIRIVLVEPSHPGNVGSAARAMKTMGLSDLALVAPNRYPHADATALASGAADVLESARVCATLEEALADRTLVMATSARTRRLTWDPTDPREGARRVIAAAGERPAVVFGRERTGLTNEELDICHGIVHIPANPDYSSLNLAAAVQVLCYELRMAQLHAAQAQPVTEARSEPTTVEEMERFYEHLERVLLCTGFLDPAAPRHLMRRLRGLFQRARPDQNEVNMLRGVLTSVERPRRR